MLDRVWIDIFSVRTKMCRGEQKRLTSKLPQQIFPKGLFILLATLILPSHVYSQSITGAVGVNLAGDAATFPTNGTFFGSLAATFDGGSLTVIDTSGGAPHYGTDFGGAGEPQSGDAVQYTFDGSYSFTSFTLHNDANLSGGINDGIQNFRLRFLDASNTQVSEVSFVATAPGAANQTVGQTFNFAPTPAASSVLLIVDSTYTRRPLQWREVAFVGTVPASSPPASPSVPDADEVAEIIIDEASRELRTSLDFNRRSNREATERFAAAVRCRSFEDELEDNSNASTDFESECDDDLVSRNQPLNYDGTFEVSQNQLDLSGTFSGENYHGERRRFIFGEFEVSRFNNDDVTASFNGRVAWERPTSNDVLLGYFLGATLTRTDIRRSFSGTRDGYGASAGVYFVDQIENDLFWDGFASVGIGRNNLELDDGSVGVEAD